MQSVRGDAAAFAADHGEPFQREGRPGTVSQQTLETLKVARHVAVDERDPDAGVHRETTVFPAEHCGSRVGVEEPLHAEPAHDTTAHLLGERGQIGLGDRPSRSVRPYTLLATRPMRATLTSAPCSPAASTRATAQFRRPVAHADPSDTGSNCSHVPCGLRFVARDSSLHHRPGRAAVGRFFGHCPTVGIQEPQPALP